MHSVYIRNDWYYTQSEYHQIIIEILDNNRHTSKSDDLAIKKCEQLRPYRERDMFPWRIKKNKVAEFTTTRIINLPFFRTNSTEWWTLLGTLQPVKCDCGIWNSWIGLADAYGLAPKMSAWHALIQRPWEDFHNGDMLHCEDVRLPACPACQPQRYRVASSNMNYVTMLRQMNPEAEIFGQKTCMCMNCCGEY